MAGRWTVLMPLVLLVWIVCCNWAQAASPYPYGANMTRILCIMWSSSTRTKMALLLLRRVSKPGKIPTTNIHVSHIHGAVHPSDTGAYDKRGNFVPKNFEKIFQKFARSEEDALSWLEVETMLVANRDLLKPLSWPAAETEWQLIHFLGKDRHGYLHKDTVRGIYDGSVFPKLRDHKIDPHSDA
ncbi:unnamed protein product [Miscanthus lutarioriparius]|uniref:Peroxygenase 4 n=1 Tax=Miscanthus lutarioriparius TaxID=422564 RepID=A0A811SG28_9POAL|nr:unnamed protein product [Miscanthus lutarioriparius]